MPLFVIYKKKLSPKQINDACKNIDAVIHSASLVDWGSVSKNQVYKINVEGTANVIKACRENNIKYLMVSSGLIYK
mgnify:CR=1 FL=1